MEALFAAEGVSKSFRRRDGVTVRALDSLSLRVTRGGLTALVGPDGAGKTTFLRLAAGLLAPDAGTLRFAGREYAGQCAEVLARVGYMPQKFGLYEDLTVQENLDLYADLKDVPAAARRRRYAELLEMSAMSPFTGRLAGRLSGGMKQKLGLICTLVAPPELLLLDEPTVGVDPLSRRELWDIVRRLAADAGMSVIVSTSYMDEAEACGDVVLLFEGRPLTSGAPEDVRRMAEGMCALVPPQEGVRPRDVQAWLLDAPGVIDAVPQGGAVRVVRRQQGAERAALALPELQPVRPRLEDSFMLLLRRQEGDGAMPVGSAAVPRPAPRPVAGSAGEPVIRTEHVFRLFGDFVAVNDVSFSVWPGEVFGLLGPNGAGKTTTFRMLCGLLPASRGTLTVAGVDVRRARAEARRHVGYVAQKFSLYGPLTVRENLEFFAGAYGLRGRRGEERMTAVTEDFSLAPWLDIPASALPGGLQRNLAMAVGLLHEPQILFLDEPTSGADPLARRQFWKRIARLSARGVTVIVTTHFMEEAEYCDHILIQDGGVRLALGTPAEIRAQAGSGGDGAATMEDAFIAIVARFRAEKAGARP
ncbi:ATP-binding cassette domain-containing protein [uncultured Desulfovibrio sp.]|uniref:ATP-binding cassette domain-containing protein n=1 Tax=uncultured Desulfovibrio sp. TaxID=167968 RepID=UPI00260D9C98|nr:ATP-binding cassette domain-containing protein [uncultured Desulfovibrio sp.]